MNGIRGWLLVYLVVSVPVTFFFAAGLAGRFFDYHWGAVAGIFFILTVPLVLLVLRLPSAPMWNIASLWAGTGSISVTLLVAALTADETRLREVTATMTIILFASIAWAGIWTMYFLRSDRVATTFAHRRPFRQSPQ